MLRNVKGAIQINLNLIFRVDDQLNLLSQCEHIQVHLNKLECREKVHFFVVTFQKLKLSYILDSLHVK